MAIEQPTPDFGSVSRTKGMVFEYLSLGASTLGIIALAILLVYVAIDAFDLTNASPMWIFTYILTLVLPFVAFCLYSAEDPALTRRVLILLGSGFIASFLLFQGFERLIRPIPGLTWEIMYLFGIVTPTTAYAAFAATQGRPAQVGFGLVGRLLGGTALALGILVLFHVIDDRLWVLVYTLGLLPAAIVYVYGRRYDESLIPLLVIPIAMTGIVLAVVVRTHLRLYPITFLIYAWTFAIPIAITGMSIARPDGWKSALWAGPVPLGVAVLGSLAAAALEYSPSPVLLVLVTVGVPTAVYLQQIRLRDDAILGILLPVLLAAGAATGTVIVSTLGFPGPDPWLDISFLTNPPSRNPHAAGLYPAIIGSIVIIALVAVISFGLGVGTAVFLEEYTATTGLTGVLTRILQINIANLAAVPSVVYGLLGLGLFANLLGFGFGTAVTAALTLSLLILPITIIAAQEAIRAVPDDLRRGSDAMGATRWQTTKNVVLPEALPGILTGTILALGRAIGETAPLIMIGAATTVFAAPTSVWSKLTAMPMQIFAWADFPQDEFRYGVVAAGVVTLLIVLLSMNAVAIIIRNRTERST